jgi:hypothetical protein
LIPREEVAKLQAKGWIRSAGAEPVETSVAAAEAEKKRSWRGT